MPSRLIDSSFMPVILASGSSVLAAISLAVLVSLIHALKSIAITIMHAISAIWYALFCVFCVPDRSAAEIVAEFGK